MTRGLNRQHRCAVIVLLFPGIGSLVAHADEKIIWSTGAVWPEPKVIDPSTAGGPPPDGIILFNGKGLSAWSGAEKWIVHDGYAICDSNDITTKQSFGDCQLHLEWQIPADVKGNGQGRGNSGVFLMGLYEVQIMDSYQNK